MTTLIVRTNQPDPLQNALQDMLYGNGIDEAASILEYLRSTFEMISERALLPLTGERRVEFVVEALKEYASTNDNPLARVLIGYSDEARHKAACRIELMRMTQQAYSDFKRLRGERSDRNTPSEYMQQALVDYSCYDIGWYETMFATMGRPCSLSPLFDPVNE